MFNKQMEKINYMLNNALNQSSLSVDSIALISSHVSRPKTSKPSTPSQPKYTKRIVLVKQQLPKGQEQLLNRLFKAKCKDLSIEYNEKTWQCFLTAFEHKNHTISKAQRTILNFSDLSLGYSCTPYLNQFLNSIPNLLHLNLSKNTIELHKLIRLQNIKEIVLNNCKLGNEPLETLFDRLQNSQIERISLSSPQIKNRNTLTRYDKLIALIKNSPTLRILQLSNIQIHPKNGIIQSSRNTDLKVIDLSQNTNVTGISPTLHSLNLSHNNITLPFTLPLSPCELQHLDLSYNKIPYYHFKIFLKTTYFPKMQSLTLNHIHLNGEIKSIQQFVQSAVHLTHLSTIDCDFTPESYIHILNGIKNNRSLKHIDLTRNKIHNERVAQQVSLMLQYTSATSLKMRNCDIKDSLGKILFKNIRKNKNIQKIDLMNNLLGDQTARSICTQLKHSKTLLQMTLQQNIIRYKDMQQIQSYLQGNKYFNYHSLDNEYLKITSLHKQNIQAEKHFQNENDKITQLQHETEQLQNNYYELCKKDIENKKQLLKKQISTVRLMEGQIEQNITLAQMKQTNLMNSISYHSDIENKSSLNPEINQLETH